jgi:hypothetical protein
MIKNISSKASTLASVSQKSFASLSPQTIKILKESVPILDQKGIKVASYFYTQ